MDNTFQKTYDSLESKIESLLENDINDVNFQKAKQLLSELNTLFNNVIKSNVTLFEIADEVKEKINLKERYNHLYGCIYSGRLQHESYSYLKRIENCFDQALNNNTFHVSELEDALYAFQNYHKNTYSKIVNYGLLNFFDLSDKFDKSELENIYLGYDDYEQLEEKAERISKGIPKIHQNIERERTDAKLKEDSKEYNWVCKKCNFNLRQHDMPRNTGTCYSDKHAHYPHNFIKA